MNQKIPFQLLLTCSLNLVLQKGKVFGKGFFKAFLSNQVEPNNTGKNNVRDLLDPAYSNKQPHQLPIQRFDVTDTQGWYVQLYRRVKSKLVLHSLAMCAYYSYV